MLCRSESDCNWLDDDLQCEDLNINFTVSRDWFGGRFADIVGQCECGKGKVWEELEVMCQGGDWGGIMIFLFVICASGAAAILCLVVFAIWRCIK